MPCLDVLQTLCLGIVCSSLVLLSCKYIIAATKQQKAALLSCLQTEKADGCFLPFSLPQKLAAECQSAGYPGTLIPYKCDLSNEEEILSMFSAIKTLHQGVDVCINNAGLARPEPLLSGKTEGWRTMIDVSSAMGEQELRVSSGLGSPNSRLWGVGEGTRKYLFTFPFFIFKWHHFPIDFPLV